MARVNTKKSKTSSTGKSTTGERVGVSAKRKTNVTINNTTTSSTGKFSTGEIVKVSAKRKTNHSKNNTTASNKKKKAKNTKVPGTIGNFLFKIAPISSLLPTDDAFQYVTELYMKIEHLLPTPKENIATADKTEKEYKEKLESMKLIPCMKDMSARHKTARSELLVKKQTS